MRLPHCPYSCIWEPVTGCIQGDLDFSRVMGIIAYYDDAIHFRLNFKPPTAAAERTQRFCCLFNRKSHLVNQSQCCGSIGNIMLAWDIECYGIKRLSISGGLWNSQGKPGFTRGDIYLPVLSDNLLQRKNHR